MASNLDAIREGGYKQKILLLIVTFVILGTVQDLWHAYVKDYHFYWSESLLFKSYWLFFLPFIWGIAQLNFPKSRISVIVNVLTISASQILLGTFIIYWIAQVAFYAPFRWQNIFNYLFKQHFIETLLIYGAIYAFLAFKNRAARVKLEKSKTKFITVVKDKKNILIKAEQILFIQTDRPYVAIHTMEQRYLNSTTLKQILMTLSSNDFIRIHKSAVINIHYLKSYSSRQNGDYDVLMKNGITLRLSRTYAKAFKEKIIAPPLGT